MRRFRNRSKVPLAVACLLVTPLFFASLMAMSLAVEKPSVTETVKNGKTVTELGDPTGATETAIWLLTLVPVLAVVLVGAFAILLGRVGVVASALAAFVAAVVLLVPLDGWTQDHTGRYPDGVDLIPRSAGSEDIYLRGEWEGTAKTTSEQLSYVTIGFAAAAIALAALGELRRRRRGATAGPPPPPPAVAEGSPHAVADGLGRTPV